MGASTTFVAVVKDECETCHLAVPALGDIAAGADAVVEALAD